MEMQTKRLLLREITNVEEEDVQRLLLLFSEEPVLNAAPDLPHYSSETLREYLRQLTKESDFLKRKNFLFSVFLQESGEFIGLCEVFLLETTSRRNSGKFDANFRFFAHRRFWGKGYMTEAVAELLPFAFYVCEAERAHALCHAENLRCQRLLLKCGFRMRLPDETDQRKRQVRYLLDGDLFLRKETATIQNDKRKFRG